MLYRFSRADAHIRVDHFWHYAHGCTAFNTGTKKGGTFKTDIIDIQPTKHLNKPRPTSFGF